MTHVLQIARRVFADRRFSILVILVSVVSRIAQLIFFYNIRVDGMYQVLAMQNFAAGHGFSSSYVLPSDLSTVIYAPQINWPPGYSLLLYPFYLLFQHNYILAGMAMDITASVVLIVFTRRILLLLDTKLQHVNLFTLVTGFFLYSFYFICSSDAIAITFFTVALYYTLALIKNGQAPPLRLALLAVCLFFCGFIKYLFIPVVFIIPVFLFLKARADKNRHIKQASFILCSFLLLSLGGVLLWQKMNSGAATYISSASRGFFPGNLANSYPAATAAIINPESAALVLKEGSQGYILFYRFLQLIHWLVFIAALTWMIVRIAKQGWKNISSRGAFFYLSFFLSAAIILLLVILSLLVGKEENIPGHWWTYTEEPRYYGLIAVVIHLSIFLLPACKKTNTKYLFYALLILLLPEAGRGVLFTTKRIIHAGTEQYSWKQEKQIQQWADDIIRKTRRDYPGTASAVTGASYYIYYRVAMYSHIPVMNDSTLLLNNPETLNTRKPALLFVITQDNDSAGKWQGIRRLSSSPADPLYKQEIAGTFAGYRIYVIHARPH